MHNGPALAAGEHELIYAAGRRSGDWVEISRLRKEVSRKLYMCLNYYELQDFAYHTGEHETEDVKQASKGPSTKTNRGWDFCKSFFLCSPKLQVIKDRARS